MKTLRYVFLDEYEVDGIFDNKGELLGTWSCNDACWRNEYFSGFISKLGIRVEESSDRELEQKLKDYWDPIFGEDGDDNVD